MTTSESRDVKVAPARRSRACLLQQNGCGSPAIPIARQMPSDARSDRSGNNGMTIRRIHGQTGLSVGIDSVVEKQLA